MIKYVKGDLFEHNFTHKSCIAHVVNDAGVMGSGFVLPLKKRFPLAESEYLSWSKGVATPYSRYSSSKIFKQGVTQFVHAFDSRLKDHGYDVIVANMCAQDLYVRERPLNYGHLVSCMQQFEHKGFSEIVAPIFGADRAKGRWDMIEELIKDIWCEMGIDVTIYYLDSNKHLLGDLA